MMKNKLMVLAVGTVTMAAMAMGSPAASAAGPGNGGNCVATIDAYTLQVICLRQGTPDTQFQVVARCPDGLRTSGWEQQGSADSNRIITMQCHGIKWVSTNFR